MKNSADTQITNSETIENNKLIAEFMGAVCKMEDYTKGNEDYCKENGIDKWLIPIWSMPEGYNENKWGWGKYRLGRFEYHSSWDWLMPVVEKIETMNLTDKTNHLPEFFIMYDEREELKGWYWSISIIKLFRKECLGREKSRIDAVYSAVIEFIKWHNQQNISLS